jgi:hypothetical protein
MMLYRFFKWVSATLLLIVPLLVVGCQPKPIQKPQSSQPSAKHFEQMVNSYHLTLEVEEPPLRVGVEPLKLQVMDTKTHEPVTLEDLEAKALMRMPNHYMEGPLNIRQLEAPGAYQLMTRFTMTGPWIIEVRLTPSAKPIEFRLTVD